MLSFKLLFNEVYNIKRMNKVCIFKPPTYLERKKMVYCSAKWAHVLLRIEPGHNIQITSRIWKYQSKYDLISNIPRIIPFRSIGLSKYFNK